MNIVAIETSCSIGSVALVRDGVVVQEAAFEKGMEHGRALQMRLDEICRAEGWRPRADLDAVTVGLGPGSFTGLRVGVACARALAYAANLPVAGVCSFDAVVRNAPEEAQRACVALDAKRGDVYYALYERRGGEWERTEGPAVGRPADLVARMPKPAWALGDALRAHEECFRTEGVIGTPEGSWAARAGVVGLLGEAMARAGQWADPERLVPIYLRRPEAEEVRRRAMGEGKR